MAVIEDYLENKAIDPQENVTQSEQNIAVFSRDVKPTTFQGAGAESLLVPKQNSKEHDFVVYNNDFSVHPFTSQISLTLKKSLFENLAIHNKAKNERISFVIYRKTSLFQSQETKNRNTVNKLNSWVISGSVKGVKLTDLNDSVITTYQPVEDGIHEKTACVFWDFSLNNGAGGWSGNGCSYKGKENGVVTCYCSHLTNFAILMVRGFSYIRAIEISIMKIFLKNSQCAVLLT